MEDENQVFRFLEVINTNSNIIIDDNLRIFSSENRNTDIQK